MKRNENQEKWREMLIERKLEAHRPEIRKMTRIFLTFLSFRKKKMKMKISTNKINSEKMKKKL
jgi:hypothetical protein